MTTPAELIERAARALSTWDAEMWDAQVAKESTSVLICRKQAETVLRSLRPDDPRWLERLCDLVDGRAKIVDAPREFG